MAAKKPRIVIIGAGMAGITAANHLYSASSSSPPPFELTVVEGGDRIGGRIATTEFGGDRIEMGATWIHGIGGSPVHAIAAEISALESDQPWECMDGSSEDPTRFVTVVEGGFRPDRSLIEPVESLFKTLMSYAQRKPAEHSPGRVADNKNNEIAKKAFESLNQNNDCLSIGSYLRKGLSLYWGSSGHGEDEVVGGGGGRSWSRKKLEEGVFEVLENNQRTYTSAGDLTTLDLVAESEYVSCSAEEVTIAKGYKSVVDHLASALPPGLVQLGKKVARIDWGIGENGFGGGQYCRRSPSRPVKVHFCDGTSIDADHVIVTVSLGVLKAGIGGHSAGLLFAPPLPGFKAEAIRRLGFGVVNKLFVKINPKANFPFLRMVFGKEIPAAVPRWMRRTASVFPIYQGSSVLLSWLAGDEALELEGLGDEEIKEGVAETVGGFLGEESHGGVEEVKKSRWGSDPLFMGSYSFVAVGSSGDDLDRMAEPLPAAAIGVKRNSRPLQILFAGEATHRTHYSTTHGAYFSGLREANRLLKHYQCLRDQI